MDMLKLLIKLSLQINLGSFRVGICRTVFRRLQNVLISLIKNALVKIDIIKAFAMLDLGFLGGRFWKLLVLQINSASGFLLFFLWLEFLYSFVILVVLKGFDRFCLV